MNKEYEEIMELCRDSFLMGKNDTHAYLFEEWLREKIKDLFQGGKK